MSGRRANHGRPRWNRHAKNKRSSQEPQPADAISVTEISSGRLLAWVALAEHERSGRFLTDILASLDHRHRLGSQDRGLAVDLASGIVRRRRTIDTLLQSQISRPRQDVEADLWRLLQLGVYQLVFARTPDHAAVDTTVELCRQLQRSRWTGFVNGVLRNMARLLTDEICELPAVSSDSDPGSAISSATATDAVADTWPVAADLVPLTDGQLRRLESGVFSDPVADPVGYVAEAFSLPNSLARRWTARLSRPQLLQACFHTVTAPVVCLRVNPLRATQDQVRQLLTAAGVEVQETETANAIRLRHASRVADLPGFAEGLWSVQDESAMQAGLLLNPLAGERILDLCAAPGGKSCHLAELSGDSATIIACDVNDTRLQRVHENVQRVQLQSVQPTLIERDGSDLPASEFDAVLVDVPCSNTGVLSRRPEARWRFREAELPELVTLQTRLLLTAFEKVKPGGRIVYSTCSIEPEETTDLIRDVVAAVPRLELIQESLDLPGSPADGAYRAVLRRV